MYCPRRSDPANRADAVRDAAGEEPVGAGVGGGLGVPAVPCLDADHDGRAAAVCGALVDRLRMGGGGAARPPPPPRPHYLSPKARTIVWLMPPPLRCLAVTRTDTCPARGGACSRVSQLPLLSFSCSRCQVAPSSYETSSPTETTASCRAL